MRLCPIFEWSLRAPDKSAIISQSKTLSYKELNLLIQHQCGYIKSLGLPNQSKLPFIAVTTPDTIAFFFACWRTKMIAVPLNFRLPKEAIDQTLTRLNSSLYTPITSALEKVVEVDESLLATMLLTSGTTAQPKIACHRLHHHLESATVARTCLNLQHHDYYVASLPFFHVGGIGLLLRTFLSGATVLITEDFFDPRITHLSLVPTQLYRILAEKNESFNPKYILLGGAPISSSLIQEASHLNLYPTYGMTETSSMIAVKGKVLPHLEVQIAEDQEILVRGKSIFEGYLQPDDTILSPLIDGWLRTKDRGHFNQNHELEVLGRKDRLFISGGENIQPEEIEEAIHLIFKLKQAVIVPYEDKEFGKRPSAYIYDPEQKITLAQLQHELRKILPGYKIPQKLFYLPHLYSKFEVNSVADLTN